MTSLNLILDLGQKPKPQKSEQINPRSCQDRAAAVAVAAASIAASAEKALATLAAEGARAAADFDGIMLRDPKRTQSRSLYYLIGLGYKGV